MSRQNYSKAISLQIFRVGELQVTLQEVAKLQSYVFQKIR
jgi:hypothetical protein